MKKKFFIVTVVLSLFLLMTGCGSNSTESSSSPSASPSASAPSPTSTDKAKTSKKHVFGASFNTMNNPHWVDWSEGLKSVIEKKGDKLVITDAENNIGKQVSDVEDLVTQKVDAIFIAPADSKGIKPALETAKSANIPVIIMDVTVADDNLVTATVATDNYIAGKILGEALIKELNGKAKVGLIDYSVVNAVVDRTNGFFDAIKGSPDIKVVARQEGLGQTDLGNSVMENFLQSNPEINAVFAVNDLSALGARSAIEAAKRTDIKIFSVDGSQNGIKAIKEGKLVGTSAQFPFKMGTIAAENVYKVIAGEKVDKLIKVPSEWIDKSNFEKFLK